jgi:hypothetical protein
MAVEENTTKLTVMNGKPGGSFYIAWIFLTALCIPVAYVVDLFIMRIATSLAGDYIYVNGVRHITEDYLALYFLVPVIGLLTGAVQYGLLRRILPHMGWWVLVTLAGWLSGMLLIALSIRLHWMVSFQMKLAFPLLGLAIGSGQWLVLRQRLPGAGWWIPANLLGWMLLALFNRGNAVNQYGLLILGVIPACATAAALALLMRDASGGVPSIR